MNTVTSDVFHKDACNFKEEEVEVEEEEEAVVIRETVAVAPTTISTIADAVLKRDKNTLTWSNVFLKLILFAGLVLLVELVPAAENTVSRLLCNATY
jgi:hypothetical protein